MRGMRRKLAMCVCVVLAASMVMDSLLVTATADTARPWYNATLGQLSKLYETGDNNDPGNLNTVAGDPGGTSYGLYMFAANAGVPLAFATWCRDSFASGTVRHDIGTALIAAYYNGGAGYGPNFNNEWARLGAVYGDTFASAQQDYVKTKFYDPMVARVEQSVPGFDMDNYSVALGNVFWSRAVQHGYVSACDKVVLRAFAALGGFHNQPEAELIEAIYKESGRLGTETPLMSGVDSRKYGIQGQSMAYFTGASPAVQTSVYTRLRINEPADALVMLMNNSDNRAVKANGVYQLLRYDNQKLAVDVSDGVKLAAASNTDAQRLTLCYYAGGFYTLCDSAGRRLSDKGGGAVAMEAPTTARAQLWTLEASGSGYTLQNCATGNKLAYQRSQVCTSAQPSITVPVTPTDATPTSVTPTDASPTNVTPTDATPTSVTPTNVQVAATTAVWQFSPVPVVSGKWLTYPGAANYMVAGSSSFPVRGVLSCAAPITEVHIYVYTANNTVAIHAAAAPNATAYDLKNLDSAVTYSALTQGSYTVKITATAGGVTSTVVSSAFTVAAPDPTAPADETYTVTFDPAGGTLQGSQTITAKLNSVYGTLPTAIRAGSTFQGWYTATGELITAYTIVRASNLTLYARYSDMHTYKFLNADGSVFASGSVAEGQLIPAPSTTPTKAPSATATYSFSSWIGYIQNVTVMGSTDVSIQPSFTETPIGGGTGGGSTGGGSTGGSTGGGTGGGSTSAGYWGGITPGTSVSAISGTVYKNGSVVTGGSVCTGMTVSSGGSTYTLVVKGDVDGSGKCGINSVVNIQSHLVGKKSLSGAYLQAADLNGDGKVTITDLVKAARVVVGKESIS